eukprot:9800658-Lingulodinium_polyedra.AAC.1
MSQGGGGGGGQGQRGGGGRSPSASQLSAAERRIQGLEKKYAERFDKLSKALDKITGGKVPTPNW